MRYSVFFKKADGEKTCVFNTTSPDLMLALMNPKVHLAADSAGTFECSLNPNSPAMSEDILERMATKVMIEEYEGHVPNEYADDSAEEKAKHDANGEKVIFYGRLLSITKDFYNTPSLYCEGAWSFLNDTVIMPYTMPKKNPDESYFTPKQALQKFLIEHNTAVGHQANVCLKFETDMSKMIVTMKDDLFSGEKNDGSGEEIDNFKVETYTNTLEVFNNLKKTYGGHFRVRYRKATPADAATYGPQMAIPIVDWIADYNNSEEGTDLPDAETYIQFGENLLDLTQKTDGANIVNCLFLTGKKVASSGSEVISDEIDIAPMCYYWMVRDNGAETPIKISSDQNQDENLNPSSGALNVHDLRFFTNVKEGTTYRNPTSLSELRSIGDIDISHVYHITSGADAGWWVWDPRINEPDGEYRSLVVSGREISDDEYVDGNVIWVRQDAPPSGYGEVNSSRIDPSWTASSRGMAWIHGAFINNVGGDTQIEYSYSMHEYSCTGFWDSSQIPPNTPIPDHDKDGNPLADPTDAWNQGYLRAWDYNSLVVYAGESYYLSSFYASNGTYKPVGIIYTKNYLKTGSATIINSATGNTSGTTNTLSKFTIPSPQIDDTNIYLNLSSKDTVSGLSQVRPLTRAQLGMQLWRTRKVDYDEYITLYGIKDGSSRWYLDSEKYTQNGKQLSRNVLRIPKRVKQLLIGTPDDETWFVYPPKAADWSEVAYPSSDDFPNDPTTVYGDEASKIWYIAKDNGYVWKWNSTSDHYEAMSPLVARAYKVNSYGVEDPVSIAKYGRIEKIVNFSSCTDPATLRDLGAKKLFEAKLEGLEIDVTALDLSLLQNNVKSPDVLDMITIKSTQHKIGSDDPDDPAFSLPLSERDIPLNDPSQQQYTIGYTGTRKITRTYDWVRK